MQLSEILSKSNIIFPLKSGSKHDAIQELLNCLLYQKYLTSTAKLFSFIDNDNQLINAAVGRGIAFHSSSSLEVKNSIAVFGVSKSGINYNSPDGQKVHFILLILDSLKEPEKHRKLISQFQNFINDSNVKSNIFSSNSSLEIFDIILNWETNYLSNEKL
tara:strand:- start:1419 stop:1898 length:480 start_codon:yes stop_codon:yes gene_type:complete